MPLVSTSVAAKEIFPKNTARVSFTIKNEDNTDLVYIKRERSEQTTVSSGDHDHVLGPGSSISLNTNQDGKSSIQGRWTCIASANTPVISWLETEDIER